MESNDRYFRRRAADELAAAQRAITPQARDRRVDLARRFLAHLDPDEARDILVEFGLADRRGRLRVPTEAAPLEA